MLADEVGGIEKRIGGQGEQFVQLDGKKVIDACVAAVLNDGDDVVAQADAAALKMTELFSRIISAL